MFSLHIIRFFTLIIIWLILYFLIRVLDKKLKYIFFIYFGLLTAVFGCGYVFYFVKYDLYGSPMPEAVYHFGDWVYTFAILFVVPFMFMILIILSRFIKHLPSVQKAILSVVAMVNAVILGYILTFVFMLIFYGFAP